MTDVTDKLLDWPMPRTNPLLPPDAYAELRQQPPCQVRLDDGATPWLLTRYADVREAMSSSAMSVDVTQPGFPLRMPVPRDGRLQSFLRMDPPEHGRLRRMVMSEFTPRATNARRAALERIVAELLDAMEDSPQPVDLVSAYALPIPSMIIATMLGVPLADQQAFQHYSRAFVKRDSGQDPMVALVELTAYLEALIHEKEQQPGEDLTSQLILKYRSTGELSHDDLLAMIRMLLIAGHETTGSQLALSALTLMHHPDQVAAMLDDPNRLGRVIEELLRYWSLTQDNQVRVTNRECQIGGVTIPAGAGIVFAISAANHDEAVFANPERFDPDREACPHLAFGQGTHYCPGAPLARLEMEVAMTALFRRFPGLRPVADVADMPFRHTTVNYGLDELWVTW